MRAICLPYIVLLVKKISRKKISSFCTGQKFFNNEKFHELWQNTVMLKISQSYLLLGFFRAPDTLSRKKMSV